MQYFLSITWDLKSIVWDLNPPSRFPKRTLNKWLNIDNQNNSFFHNQNNSEIRTS